MSDTKTCCAVCGSLHVQYAVWHSPNTGEVHDLFGSWNAGDNTYCADCDNRGDNPNPPLIDEGCDPRDYKAAQKARARREKAVSHG